MGNLGAWDGDNLKSTYNSHEGSAYYSELSVLDRFAHGVAKTIRRRLARVPSSENKPCVFILGPCPDDSSTRVPRLNSGMSPLGGSVWFVACDFASGRGVEISTANDAAIFDYVISTLKSGEKPAIIFDVAENERLIRLYPKGLQHMDDCVELTINTQDIGPASVYKVVDAIYKRRLVTPDASAYNIKLWKDKDKHIPIKTPEAGVQAVIATGLVTAWIDFRVRIKEEQTGVSGRYDVAIVEQDPLDSEKWIEHAVLELKIIKSFRSSGAEHSGSENSKWLASGLDQACCYKEENGSNFAALCCFDMQKVDNGNVCFDHIQQRAEELSIELWRWYLYASAGEYRTAEAAKIEKGASVS